jgi:hypothetical protein
VNNAARYDGSHVFPFCVYRFGFTRSSGVADASGSRSAEMVNVVIAYRRVTTMARAFTAWRDYVSSRRDPPVCEQIDKIIFKNIFSACRRPKSQLQM